MRNPRVATDSYDPNLVPAETAARKEREAAGYKQIPTDADLTPSQSINTAGGYTVDQEGLVNNYAIEPEMYIEEPGDLRADQIASQQRRRQELQEVNQTDETGKVTPGSDRRGKGVGKL
jgi:hypothetical protein